MSNSTNEILQSAFDLIENNELEHARNIIEPLLETETNNPAVWWVYAHSLEDPEDGLKAIDKVVQLDPTYPGVNDLKTQLSTSQTTQEDKSTIDDWDDLGVISPDDLETPDSLTGGRSIVRSLLIAVVVIILVVGILAVLSGAFSNNTTQSPTEVADQSTIIPTVNIQIVTNVSATEMSTEVETESPTEEPTEVLSTDEPTLIIPTEVETESPTEEPTEVLSTDEPTLIIPTEVETGSPTDEPTLEPNETQPYFTALIENLSAYEVSESEIKTRETVLGTTLDVTICAAAGPESSSALNDVMGVFVGLNSDTPEDIVAFAVTLLDCNNAQPISRTIGVERIFVQSFSDDEIVLKDFQREWKPLP